jgi:serine/threonine-protein kinase RsbW
VSGRSFTIRLKPPTIDAVGDAVEQLLAWAESAGAPEERRRELGLIADELASNVARHARAARELALRGKLTPSGALKLAVEDDGDAYDPLQRPRPRTDLPLEEREPGGLGVHLVRTLAAHVSYSRREGRNRIVVALHP